jgi:nucleoside-diphosphate-sugar epimerase
LALVSQSSEAFGNVYNVACGSSYSLNVVIGTLEKALKQQNINPTHRTNYGPPRKGDIQHSLADISKISSHLGYKPLYSFEEGVFEYISHYLR